MIKSSNPFIIAIMRIYNIKCRSEISSFSMPAGTREKGLHSCVLEARVPDLVTLRDEIPTFDTNTREQYTP